MTVKYKTLQMGFSILSEASIRSTQPTVSTAVYRLQNDKATLQPDIGISQRRQAYAGAIHHYGSA
ncbi:MAG: hypothetical protein NC117_08970 [Pseudoflavonifractor sp.]|nr:hypothetical protein [Pseudoflavonifractor sp.]